MSRVVPTKTDAKKLYDVLESEDKTLDEVALEVLSIAYNLYESKAKYAVVGQVTYSDGTFFNPTDPGASKVCLGVYPSEAKAKTDVRSLAFSAASHEEAKVWVLPVWWNSPSDWYKARREEAEQAEEQARIVSERLRSDEKYKMLASREGYCGEEFLGLRGEIGYCMLEPGHKFEHWSPVIQGHPKCGELLVDEQFNTHKCTLRKDHEGDHYNPEGNDWL